MPKKFQGENSKAAVAKARKNARLAEEQERKQKEEEDEYWRDDDKSTKKKQDRKAERERKKAEQAQHKQELKQLADNESLSSTTSQSGGSQKLTRAQIESHQAKMKEEAEKAMKKVDSDNVLPLEENVNRLMDDHIAARGLDQAIQILSVSDNKGNIDHHPERRMKAAYAAYEETMLARIKADNPNMRLSQMKQMVKKEWMKSPDNPMNRALLSSS